VPFFYRLGVKLVLTAHDQNYERTFPLAGSLDSQDRPTPMATAKSRYSMSDGVTWAKVSPAGKMSNKRGIQNFSQWRTTPPPFWTAFRDNTQHHFARLQVTPSSLRLDVYGYKGDGSAKTLQDSFEYRVDG
jgi:acid phosphatase type 7